MKYKLPKKTGGFTLIELILTIIIMAFAAIIITPYLTSVSHHPDPVIREKAIALAQAMMDEILSRRWDENTAIGGGPLINSETLAGTRGTVAATPTATAPGGLGTDGGENLTADDRSGWDDVDDYNGSGEPSGVNFFDQTGNILPGSWTGFQRTVTVNYIISSTDPIDAAIPGNGNSLLLATDSKRIVVTVTSPLGETFQLVAVKCNF
ncbi:MAG: prepilin-type N-terminal cleavage/methylation domain-containing protein [Thermodesulfobacteriota bacterium]